MGGAVGWDTPQTLPIRLFASAVCNTRLRERSVNRVLSVIEAWFNDLATISLNAYLTPNLAEFRRKIYA